LGGRAAGRRGVDLRGTKPVVLARLVRLAVAGSSGG
jgi:hypothetical protein